MVWASLAAKKQQQNLDIEKNEEYMVIFHYLIKTENSQGTFCQQRVLIKNAFRQARQCFSTVITSKMYSSIYF